MEQTDSMTTAKDIQFYLVGGAVRDRLLGQGVNDRDWVVVGATPDDMTNAGYRPVGRDFPVFLHPETQEEYALARTERKSAPGYRGFVVHTAPDVTLEDDLRRRDLTINAIAETPDGTLIDPFDGQRDIQNRVLRHVSPAFSEDPVRILRLARFRARLSRFNFSIAPETQTLVREMVDAGEVDALVAERIWQEMQGALESDNPVAFFETLKDCGALARLMPELDALDGVAQPARWHPEIDTWVHTKMALSQICRMTPDTTARFATLCHDLGKALTPKSKLPSHPGHELAGLVPLDALCSRMNVPTRYRELAQLVCKYHTHVHRATELRASTLCETLTHLDIHRKPDRFELFLLCCEADARGRLGLENRPYPQADLFRKAASAWLSVEAAAIANSIADRKRIPEQLHQARTRAIKAILA